MIGGDPSDPVGRWLVEVGYAGPGTPAPYRWSTEDLVVLDAAGTEHAYAGGLRSLGGTSPDDGTQGAGASGEVKSDVDVTVVDPEVQWWDLDPSLPCVVRRWLPGDLLEHAEVVARGHVRDLEHGPQGEPAHWSIGPDPAPVALMLDAMARVDAVTWPTGTDGWEPTEYHTAGAYYPLVFGVPGGGTPAVCPRRTDNGSFYFDPWFVICGYPETFRPIAPAAPGQTVWMFVGDDVAAPIWPGSGGPPDASAITLDGRGRAVVTLHAASDDGTILPTIAIPPAADDEVRCHVMPGVEVQGIRALPDVLDYVLGRWAAGAVDWGRLRESYGALAPYMVDTWLLERVPVWGWVAHLIEHLPVRLRRGAGGLYLQEHRVTTHPSRTVRGLSTEDGDVARVGRVLRSAGSGPFSTLRVVYADALLYGPIGLLSYGPQAEAASASGDDPFGPPNQLVHPLLTAARDRGVYLDREVEILWTWDDATAALVAEYQIARDAIPHRRVAYRVPERWRLREGDQVELTDEAVGIDAGTLALVDVPPEYTDSGVVVTLRIPDVTGT